MGDDARPLKPAQIATKHPCFRPIEEDENLVLEADEAC